jgi:hypothetical protein
MKIMFKSLRPLNLDAATVDRLSAVLVHAVRHADNGVVEWVNRAIADAEHLGRLRDKDVANLNRLEATYNGTFYQHREWGVAA